MTDLISMPSSGVQWVVRGPGEFRGRPLRYLLTTLLAEAGRDLSVAELVRCCEREGVVFRGRASKIVSDALRWEVNWGRVARVRRGVYRFARMPRSTKSWIARRVRDLRVYLARLRSRRLLPAPGVAPRPQTIAMFVT